MELFPGGKSIVVNSKNRKDYVNFLIEHQFVSSISEQVSHCFKALLICFLIQDSRNYFSEV